TGPSFRSFWSAAPTATRGDGSVGDREGRDLERADRRLDPAVATGARQDVDRATTGNSAGRRIALGGHLLPALFEIAEVEERQVATLRQGERLGDIPLEAEGLALPGEERREVGREHEVGHQDPADLIAELVG